ncbi:MAG: VCBS repeat-containing protein [Saprospiraceae bacterium]|nr:VCBS repeat-containing protein [Candidatus Opimibacter iunctus]
MKSFYILLLCVSFWANTLNGQIQFANRNDLLGEKDQHSAVPVGIADMNGDGLDDIISLNFGSILNIQYQTPDSARLFVRYEIPLGIDNAEQNDICIADFNNDGANDIMAVGSYDRVNVLYNIPFTYAFNLTYIVVTPFFSQGASAGDFNHDGWVDVVMLNDNGANYTLLNDGAGHLVEADLFDFTTVPASDNSGNYGSLYTDFDMDGDLDFYIAKCRQGVNNPADPRRIDVLFVNDGLGNYTENAAKYGLADGRQTWTADFGDIDNDGDLDLFKTQHDVISELYENIGNDTFINITPSTGLNITGVPLQGMIRDLDNDGFQDILVSGDRVDCYHNNGNKTFTKVDPFNAVIFGTFALGDLNHDGFTDIYASRVIPFNNPDPLREDILYLNQKNDNHFLALSLKDNGLNTSAIGAMALLYGPWGIQVRKSGQENNTGFPMAMNDIRAWQPNHIR